MWRLTVLVIAGAALIGCDTGPDGGATFACRDFAQTARDAADGTITASELRGRIQDVESNASLSEEPGVADAARRMLAAVTPPLDADAYQVAVDDFVAACNQATD